MPSYLINYDLYAPTTNREKVEQRIQSLGGWIKPCTTTYIITTLYSINEILEKLKSVLDDNDRLIVVDVKQPIYGQLPNADKKWIRENL